MNKVKPILLTIEILSILAFVSNFIYYILLGFFSLRSLLYNVLILSIVSFLLYIFCCFKKAQATFLLFIVFVLLELDLVFSEWQYLRYGVDIELGISIIIDIVMFAVYAFAIVEVSKGIKMKKLLSMLLFLIATYQLIMLVINMIKYGNYIFDVIPLGISNVLFNYALFVFVLKCNITRLFIKKEGKNEKEIISTRLKERLKVLKNNYDSDIISENDYIKYGQELVKRYNA